ncbi:MAG: hypothetical protein IPO48_07040 [Saprospiraceae bacterium]|nr:hypothetical protein [Saprospiraceae bacterium]
MPYLKNEILHFRFLNNCQSQQYIIRVGITGSPGVGKKYLDRVARYVCDRSRKKPAILVIDPSSQINMGSILETKLGCGHWQINKRHI